MTRNIPGCRTALSPTACGRSPLAEGAKRERRILYAPAEVYLAANGHGRIWNPPLRFFVGAEGEGAFFPYCMCRGGACPARDHILE